jgi:hypothetical protein
MVVGNSDLSNVVITLNASKHLAILELKLRSCARSPCSRQSLYR